MSDIVSGLSSKKGVDIRDVALRAARDRRLLALLLRNTRSKNDTLRYNCYRVLLEVSVTAPQALAAEWETLTGMLGSSNNYFRYQAAYLIANVAASDAGGRFAEVENGYFHLIEDESIMIASHVALNAGKIARARPELRKKVTSILFRAARGADGRRNGELLHASIVEAFSQYFPDSPAPERIIEYVHEQTRSASPKTRKAARDFLRAHGEGHT
jgi:hypothetical protein